MWLLLALLKLVVVVFGTWTTPRTWVPGELVTASMMNTHVRDNLNSIRSESFPVERSRGIYLRSHPDFDVEKFKVELVSGDEIVMSSSVRVTSGLSNLVADITVAGAGGLDTGAEAASTWYEIYVIRKSSDGTLNLLLHRAPDWTSDVSFTTARDASRALRLATSTATDKLAQGVQFASAKPFKFLIAELVRTGSPVGNVWWTLESDNAGSPSGVVLATSRKLNASLLPPSAGSNALQIVPFDTPYTVTATTQYHLVMQGDYTRSDATFVAWRGVAAGGYANGSAKQYNGTVWSAATGVGDFYFDCYLEFNNAAITYPTGYDEKCMVGYVFNTSGSDFQAFMAVDHDVRFRDYITVVSAGTGAVPTLVSIATVVPARASMVSFMRMTAAGAGNVYLTVAVANNPQWTEYHGRQVFAGAETREFGWPVNFDLQRFNYAIDTMLNVSISFAGYRW